MNNPLVQGFCHVKRALPANSVIFASARTFSVNKGRQSHQAGSSSPSQDENVSFKDGTSSRHREDGPQASSNSSSFQTKGAHENENWSESQEKSHYLETDYEHSVKQKILSAALHHVHELGWSNESLEAGAGSEGLPPIAHGMFPRGGAEIVEYFYTRSNEDLTEYLQQEIDRLKAENIEKPKTVPFVKKAIETRLKMILPYKDIWTQAMAIQTLPQNSVHSWKNLMNLCDEIWYYAGDKSTDFNWYTKRLTLAAVYKATEIYMLQDTSMDHQATWQFLNRRMEDVQKLGSASKQFGQSGSVFKEGLYGMYTMGRNILGMNSRNR